MASTCDCSLDVQARSLMSTMTATQLDPLSGTRQHTHLGHSVRFKSEVQNGLQDVRGLGGVRAVSFILIQRANLISGGEGNSN